jgi:hypothetical protein
MQVIKPLAKTATRTSLLERSHSVFLLTLCFFKFSTTIGDRRYHFLDGSTALGAMKPAKGTAPPLRRSHARPGSETGYGLRIRV